MEREKKVFQGYVSGAVERREAVDVPRSNDMLCEVLSVPETCQDYEGHYFEPEGAPQVSWCALNVPFVWDLFEILSIATNKESAISTYTTQRSHP